MSRIHRAPFAFGVVLATAMVTAHGASAYTYKVIHDFCSKRLCADGNSPMSGVIMDGAGNLYGTTLYGGTAYDGAGVAYELTPDAQRAHWKSRTIHTFAFNHQNGGAPWAAPILDTSGNLYGTTVGGGAFDHGTVYELLPNGDKAARTLKLLVSLSDSWYPYGGVTYQGAATGVPFDGTSPLYGTTTQVGSFFYGSVYQLTLNGSAWNLDTLYRFCPLADCKDGNKPLSAVTLDANGHVFGTASAGGQFNQGVTYELVDTGGTWTYSDVHDFCGSKKCHDGAIPSNALVSDVVGNFYGTASSGGEHHNAGLIFKLAPDGTYTPVYSFCTLHSCADGALPQTDFLMVSGGTLYGVTTNGGGNNIDYEAAGGGTVFAFNGSTLETLYRFCALKDCRDGEYPLGGLIMDAQGNIFGTTSGGGKHGRGVVFELTP